jgi:hypothetical protein
MDDCTSLDPDNHNMVLQELKQANLWVGRMDNMSGCHHRVFARLISTSTSLSDTAKEKIERVRVQSKWLDHICAFHGTKTIIGHGTFLLMDEYKESLETKLQRDRRLTSEKIVLLLTIFPCVSLWFRFCFYFISQNCVQV